MACPPLNIQFKISTTSPKTQEKVEISVPVPQDTKHSSFSGHVQQLNSTPEELKFANICDDECKAVFIPKYVGCYEVTVSVLSKPCSNSPMSLLVAPSGELKEKITGRPKVNNPHDIVEFGKDFIITNKGNHEVTVTDRSGILKNKFIQPTLSRSQTFEPYGVAVRNNTIVVSDLDNHRVIRYNQNYVPEKEIGVELLKRPTGIAIDEDDKIFVADDQLSCIQVFDFSGTHVKTIGREGFLPGQLKRPWFIALHKRKLVVADCHNCRVQIFNSITGEVINCFKVVYEGNDMHVRGVAVDENGIIYVTAVTNTKKLRKVGCCLAYTIHGEIIGRFGGNFSFPRGIRIVKENGDFLAHVVDGGHQCIKVLKL